MKASFLSLFKCAFGAFAGFGFRDNHYHSLIPDRGAKKVRSQVDSLGLRYKFVNFSRENIISDVVFMLSETRLGAIAGFGFGGNRYHPPIPERGTKKVRP